MKGKSAEGDSDLKLSAWAYAEDVYDCHRLDGVLRKFEKIAAFPTTGDVAFVFATSHAFPETKTHLCLHKNVLSFPEICGDSHTR